MSHHNIVYFDAEWTKIYYEEHHLNEKYHRLGGPARISYYKNGNIYCEDYQINGQRHREDGPAFTLYHQDGSLWSEVYYLNGEEYTQEEWFRCLTKEQKIAYILKEW